MRPGQARALAGRRTASASQDIGVGAERVRRQSSFYIMHVSSSSRRPRNPKAAGERQVHNIRQLFEESGGRPTMLLA